LFTRRKAGTPRWVSLSCGIILCSDTRTRALRSYRRSWPLARRRMVGWIEAPRAGWLHTQS
jgi:hypothetical protein